MRARAGVLRLRFVDGDTYTWNKVVTSINNLILGKIYIDHGGIMKVSVRAQGRTSGSGGDPRVA